MRQFRILLLLLGGALASPAQTNAPDASRMSLEDCIEVALRHNLDVQIQRYNPELAKYTLNIAYGGYDPTFFASGEHDYNQSPGGIDPQGRIYGGTETDANNLRGGLSGLLPWGMNYSIGGAMTDTWGTRPALVSDPNNPTVITNSFVDLNTGQTINYRTTNFATINTRAPFENTVGNVGILQLRQPLLKNFWIDSTRLQIVLDKKNLQISELTLRNQVMSTVTAVEHAYYELIFAQENIKVQQKAVELAERQLADNKKRVEVGAMAPLDQLQAESQAAQSRSDLLAAIGNEETQQRVLKSLISDDYSKWEKVAIQPTSTLLAIPEKFNLQESWRKGLSQRPDLLEQKLNLEKQGHVIKYQRNQLFPQLDAFGTYGYNASGVEFSDSLNQIANRNNPFWTYGASVSIPLGQISARNNYKAAKATQEQIVLQTKQMEQNVLIQIENAISVANTSFQRVEASRQARIYAEAALDAEQKKLESGKSTVFVVLQLTKDLTQARLSEIRALADYNNALADTTYYEGSTLERRVTLAWK